MHVLQTLGCCHCRIEFVGTPAQLLFCTRTGRAASLSLATADTPHNALERGQMVTPY